MKVYDDLTESEMLERVCQFFSDKGYQCEKHVLKKYNGRFIEFDLVCKKDGDIIIVEIKKARAIHENYVRDILRKLDIPSLRKAKFYLCIPVSTDLPLSTRKLLEANGIGVVTVSREKVQIELPAKEMGKRGVDFLTTSIFELLISTTPVLSTFRPIVSTPKFKNYLSSIIKKLEIKPYKLRISRELLDKIDDLHAIKYSDLLKDFKKEYENAKNPKNENDIVLKTLKMLWAGQYGKTTGLKAFYSFEKFEPILREIPGYRDHMIHPFQVFLMGAIIIDKYYDDFQQFFKRKLKNAYDDSLDFAWLLCSTFHDICYPIQLYESFNKAFFMDFLQSETSPIIFQAEKLLLHDEHLKYIDQLIALYSHLNDTKSKKQKWEFDTPCKINDTLRSLMLNEIANKNHALLSAIALIKKILAEEFVKKKRKPYLRGRFSTDVYPAALAIAIHDQSILRKLREPITLEDMPLSFLLVYCDLVQEFGRSEREEVAELHSFDCESDVIEATLVFGQKYHFNKKAKEMEKVFKKIASEKICFRLNLRFKGSTRSENSCKA
ncbi:MAG: hypothetical protein QXJ31_02855 [Candidatus Bathyarchaeia archaeon]